MKYKSSIISSSPQRLAAAFAGLSCMFSIWAADVAVEKGAFAPEWESVAQWECPEWFKDAKFGIWAHWGPQCQAESGDWYARGMYDPNGWQNGRHKEQFGDPASFGMKDLCNAWKADAWNPEELVALYQSVGARYFFTLGQHHDNFDLWDSPYQEWNSVNVGPKQDIVKGWADACRRHGLPLGISMHGSHTWTWMEPARDFDGLLTKADGAGTWWDGLDPQELYEQRHEPSRDYRNFGTIHSQWDWANGASLPSQAYKQKFQNRVLECINTFNPDMIYFDDTVLPFYGCDESVGLNILAHYYNHSARLNNGQQQVVVMGKQLNDAQKDVLLWDVERGVPDRPQQRYWQTCTCIGQWHYDRGTYDRGDYKSAQQVIGMLVDVVSKNGNLLLSVPIKGNGSIDEKERAILQEIKAWMDINSESIYGTRPYAVFGEGPLAETSNPLKSQGFNDKNNYSAADVRYVQKNGDIYATILRWPEGDTFTFRNIMATLPAGIRSVSLLGHGEVDYTTTDGLTVMLPAERPNPIAPVFKISLNKQERNGAKI